jgi:hypothetical protein
MDRIRQRSADEEARRLAFVRERALHDEGHRARAWQALKAQLGNLSFRTHESIFATQALALPSNGRRSRAP